MVLNCFPGFKEIHPTLALLLEAVSGFAHNQRTHMRVKKQLPRLLQEQLVHPVCSVWC